MHPRNPYRDSPDFSALAAFFPPLKPFVSLSTSGKPSIDFKDPQAQRALTQALLKRDFDLTLTLPENRLCPTIPNRLNYILWIQDILLNLNLNAADEPIKGLDIGTGASAIYPLLGCSLSTNRLLEFVGTEIDPLSAGFASQNVEANNLGSRISIWLVNTTAHPLHTSHPILAPLIEDPDTTFHFTMCNPPFYGSTAEIENSAEGKELPPNAVCTGAETEMITPGGETTFVLKMVHESTREGVRNRCRWFTSMLGKLSSVGAVVEELRKLEIHNYALTQFIQGATRRWAVGWSFGDKHLPDTIARPTSSSLASYIPAATTLRQDFSIRPPDEKRQGIDATPWLPAELLWLTLTYVLASIEGLVVHELRGPAETFHEGEDKERAWSVDVLAKANTWSRAARRKRKRSSSPLTGQAEKITRLDSTSNHVASSSETRGKGFDVSDQPALHCRICVFPSSSQCLSRMDQATDPQQVRLEAQWVKGADRALFEGFWSHICRKAKDRMERPSTG